MSAAGDHITTRRVPVTAFAPQEYDAIKCACGDGMLLWGMKPDEDERHFRAKHSKCGEGKR